ncbi:MAG: tetratricopeptide repeat protein [Desmonostoc vinosum HA7617-LM4]|jgi:CHAT domain-containing protein/Flp pilus assembly protein TadD|nr:tetratricopeptide repeat protein [Desmonostoc vinosum HA7617-LM4]
MQNKQWISWCFLPNITRCSLTLLLSVVLLSDSVGATLRYTPSQIAQQPTTTQDATSTAAKRLFEEGLELYNQGTVESLRQAIEKWEEALKLWREVDNKAWEAGILFRIGKVYDDLGDKQKALSFYSQALPISRAVSDRRGEAIILNNIGLVYDSLGDKQKALSFFNQALPISRAVGNKRGEATTLNNIGLVYNSLGDKQKALSFFNQTLTIDRATSDRQGEATTLNNIGSVYSDLGDKQKALSFYNQALPLRRATSDRRGEAATLANIGNVYDDLGDKQKALSFYNQALPILRAVGYIEGEATTLNNIGLVYDDLGDKQKALSFYNQALAIHRTVGNRAGEATVLNNIGLVYDSLADKQKALTFYNQALPIFRAVGNKEGEANTLTNIGVVYSDLGDKQKALSFYNQALPISRAIGDRQRESETLNGIGAVYSDLGDKQKALSFYNQALSIKRAIVDRKGEAIALSDIGTVYSDLGDKQKALSFYNQALPISRAIGYRAGEASILVNIGAVYSDLGDKQKALSFYNQALPILRAVGYRAAQASTLYNIAFTERNRGNLQQALTQVEAAIKIIEDLRTKIDSQELRASYFASKQDVYKFYIDLLMQLHKKDPSKGYDALALQASDRSRARSLIELLTEANIDIKKDIDPKLLAEEQRLQLLVDAKEKQLSQLSTQKEPPNQLVAQTKQQLENLLKQQQELKVKIRATNPEYANLKYPQPLTLSEIQQQLDKNTLLLQYSLGEERSYLWVVTPNSLDTYELPKREQIEKLAKNLYNNYLRNPGMQGVSPEETAKAADELSKLILAPVADKLEQQRIVIVGDDALQYIPFAALTSGKSATGSNYQPLVVNHEIISLPSISTIAIIRQQLKTRAKAPKTLAILADPVFTASDERVTGKSTNTNNDLDIELQQSALNRSARNINLSQIERLKNTRTEAQEILKLIPSDRLQAFDFDANYNWATNKQLSQYRMLHFATHGFLDSTNPELSGIVLSLIDKQGKPQKGFLRLAEIFNLDFPAELVVLSACETGLGKEVKGEGLVGLTRGLMYAGAARVVVSLWNVNDEATSLLMRQFYSEMLQRGLSPAAALRAAQLKLWQQEQWRNPYSWAGFTLLGEWQ